MSDNTQPSGQGPSDTRRWVWPLSVGLVFLIALAIRVLKGVSWEFSLDSDLATVQIMIKHVAEGLDYPVFFYGQPYMGSFETLITGMLCRVFGTTSLVIALASALFGTLALPFIYLWGRAAGGKRAGLLAMAYCAVGSSTYFSFTVIPRCGYASMFVCGLITVWLATRIAAGRSEGRPVSMLNYLGMGLAAGLGWWANQLVVPFLAAAALILLPTLGKRNGWPGVFVAAGAFVVGCSPWWLWNLSHEWQSVSYFTTSTQKWSILFGLRCAGQAFRSLFEVQRGLWQNNIQFLLLIGLIAGFFLLWLRDMTNRWSREQAAARWAAVIVCAFNIYLYARTDYGCPPEPRYLIPMFPAVAIMLAVSADWVVRRFGFVIGLLLFALAMPKHLYVLPSMFENKAAERALWMEVEENSPRIAALCDGVCIGGGEWNWINFASREVLIAPMMPKDRYNPRTVRAELADRPAYFSGFGRVETFVRNTAGSCRHTNLADGIVVTYGLAPPPADWDYVRAADIVECRDDGGADFRTALADRDLGTGWATTVEPGKPVSLTYAFDKPVDLCGIRFLTPDDRGPHQLTIEGQSAEDGEWFTLLPKTGAPFFFWSGPFPIYNGIQFFPEFRFSSPAGGVRRIRLTLQPVDTPYHPWIGDILLLRKAPAADTRPLTVDACADALKTNGVNHFYGPRWLVNRLAARGTGSGIAVRAPSIFQCSMYDLPAYDSRNPYPLVLRDTTGFLMDPRDVPGSRAVLEQLNLEWEESALGPYALIVVRKPDPDGDAANHPALCWTELGCFANDAVWYRKAKAERLFGKAVPSATNRIDLLSQAVTSYPTHQPARQALIAALTAAGRADDAAAHEAELKSQTVPGFPARVRFANGVELLGLSFPSRDVKIGGEFAVEYFWKRPPALRRTPGVFVHFRNTETVFQDDHRLLEKTPKHELEKQPFDEVFVERRIIKVPPSLSPGDTISAVRIGLLDGGRRVRPETDATVESEAIVVPVSLTAQP